MSKSAYKLAFHKAVHGQYPIDVHDLTGAQLESIGAIAQALGDTPRLIVSEISATGRTMLDTKPSKLFMSEDGNLYESTTKRSKGDAYIGLV